jgi:hypothetical protein
MSPLLKIMGVSLVEIVTKSNLQNDEARRPTMEEHLGLLPVEPLKQTFQMQLLQEMRSMGNVRITFVEARGKTRLSFAYSCSFTAVGGAELVVQGLHRSMSDSRIQGIINYLFTRHQEGHPLAHGHTIDGGDVVYLVQAPPADEATLIKASETLEPTRLYGLAGYKLLLLVPVGVNSEEDADRMTHEEVLALALKGGFPNVKMLESCAWCHKTRDTATEAKHFKCSGCKDAFYCSPEHQKLAWKDHKPVCQLTKQARSEAQLRSALGPFGKDVIPFMKKNFK